MPDITKQQWIERCVARFQAKSDINDSNARDFAEACWECRESDTDSPEKAADVDMSYWEE